MKRRIALGCAVLAIMAGCASPDSPGNTDSASEGASTPVSTEHTDQGSAQAQEHSSSDGEAGDGPSKSSPASGAGSEAGGSSAGSTEEQCRPGSTSASGEEASCSVPSTSESQALPADLTGQKIGWLTYGMPKGWTPMPGVEASTVANAWVGSDSSDYLTVLRGASTMGNTDYGQAVDAVQRWQHNHLVSGDELFERTFTTDDKLLRIHETQLRAANSYVEYDWVIEQISTGEIAHVTLALTQADEKLIDHVRQSLQHVK